MRGFVRPSVGPLVRQHESKSGKTRICAPAHPSATGGRVSGLVFVLSAPSFTFAFDARLSRSIATMPYRIGTSDTHNSCDATEINSNSIYHLD